MKFKILAILVVTLGCLAVTLTESVATSDGTNPPHAVDIAGRVIPQASTTMPDKPLILANDSTDPKWAELGRDAAFDHVKHTTDEKHSLDGKTVTACVECHHTEQPSAPAGQEYLKWFERNEPLTAKQLEDSKQPVRSCRACHFQEASEETDEFPPKGVIYPKNTGRPPSGKLTNDVAYHINCITCHNEAKKRDPSLKAPETCIECHARRDSPRERVSPLEQARDTEARIPDPVSTRIVSDPVSNKIVKAARDAKESITRDVRELKVRRVPNPDSTQPVKTIDAYRAEGASDTLTNTKARLLESLSGNQLEGLRAYVERAFPAPSQLSVFRVGKNTFVGKDSADEAFKTAAKVIDVVGVSKDMVEITITSLPEGATFKLLSFGGKPRREICTSGCSVTIYRGNYKYEVVMVGYKQKRFDLLLLHREPKLKLDCRMVKVGEANEPPPCKETGVPEN